MNTEQELLKYNKLKAQRKAAANKYREKNRDKLNEYGKAYYQQNREEILPKQCLQKKEKYQLKKKIESEN